LGTNQILIFLKTFFLDETGYIINVVGTAKTNIAGVLYPRCCRPCIIAITAAGTGCMAALDAERYLG
jgi:thioredoxin reductase (NADPH)